MVSLIFRELRIAGRDGLGYMPRHLHILDRRFRVFPHQPLFLTSLCLRTALVCLWLRALLFCSEHPSNLLQGHTLPGRHDSNTMAQFLCLFTFLSLVLHASALQVTPNSPCSSSCVDSDNLNFADPSSSNTKNKDIVCYDSEYQSSSAGSKFQQCLSCLQNSTYTQGAESDQLWFLCNYIQMELGPRRIYR